MLAPDARATLGHIIMAAMKEHFEAAVALAHLLVAISR